MSQVKYKNYIDLMYNQNQELFEKFVIVHDNFANNPKEHGMQFHKEGQKVIDIMRDWERRLCRNMGKGQFSAYAVKLSEKYWLEIEKKFPLIRKVGVKSNFD